MPKLELIKFSGWAFIAGSFAFVSILSGSDPIAMPGSVISSILLAVGMLGLRARYGERAGNLGKSMLLLGVIGPILWCIAIASMVLMGLSGIVTVAQVEKGLWIVLFGGPAITLLGLTLFGLVVLHRKPMPRLNWLPFFAGIWYPAVYLFLAGYLFTHDREYPQQFHAAFQMMFLIQFVALCAFGASLLTNTSQETASV